MKRMTDKIDERIVGELTRNARITHAELAGRVHLSRNAVRQRIERLERDGIIQGYTIVAKPEGDRQSLAALIFVYRQDRMRGADVIQALRGIPEVIACDVVSGEFDLIVRVESPDSDRIRQIWEEIARLPGVRDTLTAFMLSPVIRR
jgi:Lrp/AsnC family leucine-responsive transcriptional regulator